MKTLKGYIDTTHQGSVKNAAKALSVSSVTCYTLLKQNNAIVIAGELYRKLGGKK